MRSLIITGMHRSHTSLAAEGFHKAGLFLGDSMIGATSGNAHGHFEAQLIVDFHQKIITEQSLKSWWRYLDRQKASSFARSLNFQRAAKELISTHFDRSLFGWKDPRAPFFMEGWHEVLSDPHYIFVLRRPQECVHSLNRRSLRHVRLKWRPYLTKRHYNLWDDTNACILSFVKKHPDRCLVIHALKDLLHEPSVSYLNEVLRDQWKLDLAPVSWTDIYDPSLVKSQQVPPRIDEAYAIRKTTKDLYQELLAMSIGQLVI